MIFYYSMLLNSLFILHNKWENLNLKIGKLISG